MKSKRFGRYQVEQEIGRGGMSVVYCAWDPSLERPVAVKVLHPHLADRADSRARFTREAKAVARLHHGNIVEVYDYSSAESEQAYIVTEFIDGPTLRSFVDEHPIRHGEAAALLVIPVLEALEHAHKAGIVHRDVKPENVMIRADGTPVLMDFGIAQMVDQDTLTATGTMLGSPAHMAPEIVEGEDITTRADLFSLGTVMYWLVCGALPFSAPSPAALFRRIAECRFDPVLERRPHAGRGLARLIESCMAHAPSDRPASAGAIAQTLRTLLEEAGLTDPGAELAAFLADPDVYQDRLGRRLVPAYVANAERAWADKQTGRALDFLDRALALDEHDETAQTLLRRIERGQRRGRFAKMLAAAAVAGAAVGVFVVLVPTTRNLHIEVPTVPETVAAPPTAALATVPSAAPASMVALVSSAPTTEPVAPATTQAPATVAAAAPKTRPRAFVRRTPIKVAPETIPPPARLVPVPLRGELKSAEVWVNGEMRGYLATLGRGVVVKSGQKITIELRNPGCYTDTHRFYLAHDAPGAKEITHTCRWKPAYFKVASNVDADVLDTNGRPLGRTNRDIKVRMRDSRQELAITVSYGKNRVREGKVSLQAGGKPKQVVMNF